MSKLPNRINGSLDTRRYLLEATPSKDSEYLERSERCRNEADSFEKIVRFCLEYHSRDFFGEHSIVANAAFACELYMKALLFLERKNIKGHDLANLYNYLSSENQRLLATGHPCSNIRREHFENELHDIGMAFEAYRYMYEYTGILGINYQFLLELLMTLKSVTRGKPRSASEEEAQGTGTGT